MGSVVSSPEDFYVPGTTAMKRVNVTDHWVTVTMVWATTLNSHHNKWFTPITSFKLHSNPHGRCYYHLQMENLASGQIQGLPKITQLLTKKGSWDLNLSSGALLSLFLCLLVLPWPCSVPTQQPLGSTTVRGQPWTTPQLGVGAWLLNIKW